ncbi:E3 ubiquitin-protein ligase RHA2A-like [Magnolia sinica]|uniref:E3 ubiquitin-protein ligase RHA2A-like n=1 Tax=Magnolia sinica TaxID=86752 RepID=UPI00265974B4|nr:E3 ubiquitin-protein ligase RHA2A-like [Magnolia sinica]
MGLSSDLNNVSSDSIPLLVVALVAHGVCYLRSMLFCFLQFMGVSSVAGGEVGFAPEGLFGAVGSGLASVVLLAEQLNVHRVFTFRGEAGVERDCIVCLNGLSDGDQVRRLVCGHVFHKECLDGWLEHRNMSCPLCRAPLVKEERLVELERRVGEELVTWFSPTH